MRKGKETLKEMLNRQGSELKAYMYEIIPFPQNDHPSYKATGEQ